MPHRILSLDGGVGDLFYLRCLREIELARPGFIARADGCAGVSDGANAAMLLARTPAEKRDVRTIEAAIRMTDEILTSMQPGVCGWLRLLSLVRALKNGKEQIEIFNQYVGATTRLRDLPGKVTLLSYRVRDDAGITVFQNYGPESLGNQLCSEVMMQGGAFPAILPVTEGHVDGGLFGNNPSAIAVSQAVDTGKSWAIPMDSITLLSCGFDTEQIGGRCVQAAWQKPSTDWGLLQWFLYPLDPLLFCQALFNSGDYGASFQCQHLLGGRFQRLSVPSFMGVIGGITQLMLGRAKQLIEKAEQQVCYWRDHPGETSIKPCFADMLAWVDAQWMTTKPAPVARVLG
jgi:hypothetical protein